MKSLWLAGCIALAVCPVVCVAAPAAMSVTKASVRPAEVLALAEKVADYQLATLAAGLYPTAQKQNFDNRGWVQGTFFKGLTELAGRSDKPHYRQAILARGEANQWRLADRPYHADDHLIGQTYFWSARNGAGPDALKPMKAVLDGVLANPSAVSLTFVDRKPEEGPITCLDRWCWCDALFMAPATWLEMSKVTGDPRYAAFAMKEFRATTNFLFDKAEGLYYRDSRFFDQRGPNGEKIFWSRGNGWVMGGFTYMIPLLEAGSTDRAQVEALFRQMAAKLKTRQRADGFWSPSLLGDPAAQPPESSGTGFYVYALAWGVKNGLLDRATYEPVIRRGWTAMVSAVHPDGRMGYVQPIGAAPDKVTYEDTQFYGTGAFLLAAAGMADLNLK